MNMFGRFRQNIIGPHGNLVESDRTNLQSESFDGDEEYAIRSGQRCVKLKTKCPEVVQIFVERKSYNLALDIIFFSEIFDK